MRVLMLSRDLAPDAPGARASRVRLLAEALAAAGHDVHLIVAGRAPGESTENGVRLIQAGEYPPMISESDRVAWALQFNASVLERATRLLLEQPVDVLHAHEWDVAWAAASIKSIHRLPLVSTIHGKPRTDDRLVLQAQWWLTYESRRTIAVSRSVREEIERAFELPPAKQEVINHRLGPATLAVRTAAVYAGAIEEEEEHRRAPLQADRPSLRVVLGRSPLFAGRDRA
jgi:glycosyltransferase involved in cell wall biosynthesis